MSWVCSGSVDDPITLEIIVSSSFSFSLSLSGLILIGEYLAKLREK